MEIKAKCKFDLASMKALVYVSTFKKGNPKKQMILRAILFFVALIAAVLCFVVLKNYWVLAACLAIDLFYILLYCFIYFAFPKKSYNALANLKEAENEYVFCDDFLMISTVSAEYYGDAKIGYSLLVKAFETSKYFFLYQTQNQVLIVDKSTMEAGAAEELKNKLSAFLKKKYYSCRY
ncbi:MAG: YcxB family protein [Clostridia bacterium]|nr:YcxB family protein [Clostridia bacterium]